MTDERRQAELSERCVTARAAAIIATALRCLERLGVTPSEIAESTTTLQLMGTPS